MLRKKMMDDTEDYMQYASIYINLKKVKLINLETYLYVYYQKQRDH